MGITASKFMDNLVFLDQAILVKKDDMIKLFEEFRVAMTPRTPMHEDLHNLLKYLGAKDE